MVLRPGHNDLMSRRPLAVGLAAGVALDALLGDPRRGHPVAAFGRAATALEARDYADSRLRGAGHAAACVLAVAAPAALLQRRTRGRPTSEAAAVALAVWAVTGARSLHNEAERALLALASHDLPAARRVLPSLCGRDPAGLDAPQLARAVIESVAENTSDAVVAPLLWGAVAGLPGLAAYRAINTLDAMVGYRSPRYLRFGWASARLDDVANWIPARVTAALTIACAPVVPGPAGQAPVVPVPAGQAPVVPVPAGQAPVVPVPAGQAPVVPVPAGQAPVVPVPAGQAPVVSGPAGQAPVVPGPEGPAPEAPLPGTSAQGPPAGGRLAAGPVRRSASALRAVLRDGGRHPSPNAGRCEAAFAGALGVRLGGTNVYGGVTEVRPGLGEGRTPEPDDIRRAIRLSRAVTMAATGLAVLIALTGGGRRTRSAREPAPRWRPTTARAARTPRRIRPG
jgi:adenosylcobinamide-phosphate synthase